MSNQKCMIQPTRINLHSNEYNQEFHYHPFAIKLDRCIESCNTLNHLSNKVCVLNKTEDLNIHVFDMITGKSESNILTKDMSCECKCKFHGRKCNSSQKWNNVNAYASVKNIIYVKKIIFGILLHEFVKMVNI